MIDYINLLHYNGVLKLNCTRCGENKQTNPNSDH